MTNGVLKHQMDNSSGQAGLNNHSDHPMVKKSHQSVQESMSPEQYRKAGLIKFN